MKRLLIVALVPVLLLGLSDSYCFDGKRIRFTQKEWEEKLTDEEFDVMRMGHKEPAYTGKYRDSELPGIYECAACSLPLFSSQDKIAPVRGYATFTQPICNKNVIEGLRFHRWSNAKELQCARCRSFVGRMHDDPTKEYRLYSVALDFQPFAFGAGRGGPR